MHLVQFNSSSHEQHRVEHGKTYYLFGVKLEEPMLRGVSDDPYLSALRKIVDLGMMGLSIVFGGLIGSWLGLGIFVWLRTVFS